jgi:cysteine synthase A
MTVLSSIVEAVGRTPLVALDRLTAELPGRVLLKLEYLNPGASMKDRIGRQIVESAEASGRLKAGDTVVELTSGNTGIGLALACAVKGYRFIAVMSEGNSPERRRILRALGAEVELVPQAPGAVPGQVSGDDLALVEKRAAELTKELGAFRADQFNNADNARAHELTTGPEIWASAGERIDAFCAIVGTAGTFVGVTRALKQHDPRIRAYAVEPASAPFLAGGPIVSQSHKLQGAGYALLPPLWDPSLCDGYVAIADDEALDVARALARREGVLAGPSTGANVAAALRIARDLPAGGVVVTIASDSAMKYLSTDLYE